MNGTEVVRVDASPGWQVSLAQVVMAVVSQVTLGPGGVVMWAGGTRVVGWGTAVVMVSNSPGWQDSLVQVTMVVVVQELFP